MTIKKKKTLSSIVVAAFAATFFLCSCSKQQNISTVDIENLEGSSSEKVTLIGEDSKMVVDADVLVPSKAEYGVYTASYSNYEPQLVKSILLGDVEAKLNEYPSEKNGIIETSYIWNYENTELYFFDSTPMIMLTSDLYNFINCVFSPPYMSSEGNAEMFESCELSFCTGDEAVEAVLEILNELGINVADNPDVYSLSQSDLKSVVNLYTENNIFNDYQLEYIPDTVDSSHECYYIKFNAAYNGIPLYNQYLSYKTITDFTMSNPEINAIYSADGLKYLCVTFYRGDVQEIDEVTRLISAEAAAQTALNKYKDVVTASEINFDAIELMYVYTPLNGETKLNEKGSVKMSPAWVCSGTIVSTEQDKFGGEDQLVTEKVTVLIDAMTGMEII